jgi:hypothetical protein
MASTYQLTTSIRLSNSRKRLLPFVLSAFASLHEGTGPLNNHAAIYPIFFLLHVLHVSNIYYMYYMYQTCVLHVLSSCIKHVSNMYYITCIYQTCTMVLTIKCPLRFPYLESAFNQMKPRELGKMKARELGKMRSTVSAREGQYQW